MNPRCEFYWVVRTDFWLSKEHVSFLFDLGQRALSAFVEHSAVCPFCEIDLCEAGEKLRRASNTELNPKLHDWLNAAPKPMGLTVGEVAAVVDLLGDRPEHPMLKEIFTAALKFMREHAERR